MNIRIRAEFLGYDVWIDAGTVVVGWCKLNPVLKVLGLLGSALEANLYQLLVKLLSIAACPVQTSVEPGLIALGFTS